MDDGKVQEILRGLMTQLTALTPVDREYIAELFESTVHTEEGMTDGIHSVQDKLGYIVLYLKYLQLDLEATRRENAIMRRILDQTTAEEE